MSGFFSNPSAPESAFSRGRGRCLKLLELLLPSGQLLLKPRVLFLEVGEESAAELCVLKGFGSAARELDVALRELRHRLPSEGKELCLIISAGLAFGWIVLDERRQSVELERLLRD